MKHTGVITKIDSLSLLLIKKFLPFMLLYYGVELNGWLTE